MSHGWRPTGQDKRQPIFDISLAEWSLHKTIFGGKMTNLDFPKAAKDLGIHAVEYVNQFFKDKANDQKYLADLKQRCDDLGVKSLLIMCDGEGALGDADEAKRTKAVENHYRWVEAAKFLGCHSIRVNAQSSGSYDEQVGRAADGLRRLSEFGAKHNINVIVENHGGLSSNGAWLSAVMKKVDHKHCGTLPDFGNFRISGSEQYDRYQGVDELMPFAKAERRATILTRTATRRRSAVTVKMMKIVLKHGYHGYCGIEYEGKTTPETEGIVATKKLLERVRQQLVSG